MVADDVGLLRKLIFEVGNKVVRDEHRPLLGILSPTGDLQPMSAA